LQHGGVYELLHERVVVAAVVGRCAGLRVVGRRGGLRGGSGGLALELECSEVAHDLRRGGLGDGDGRVRVVVRVHGARSVEGRGPVVGSECGVSGACDAAGVGVRDAGAVDDPEFVVFVLPDRAFDRAGLDCDGSGRNEFTEVVEGAAGGCVRAAPSVGRSSIVGPGTASSPGVGAARREAVLGCRLSESAGALGDLCLLSESCFHDAVGGILVSVDRLLEFVIEVIVVRLDDRFACGWRGAGGEAPGNVLALFRRACLVAVGVGLCSAVISFISLRFSVPFTLDATLSKSIQCS